MLIEEIHYLAIEGVIGAGKTSLANLLAKHLGGSLFLEKFEENPFLSDFYRDPKRFAFQTQIFFLLNRFRQQQQMIQRELFDERVISDYVFAKDRIFARVTLQDRELALYDKVATILEKDIPKPDLVIYLQASTERLLQNIQKRGRPYEKWITEDYIRSLNEAYNDLFFHYKATPLLVINTSEIDFVNNIEDREGLIYQVLRPRQGTTFYSPKK